MTVRFRQRVIVLSLAARNLGDIPLNVTRLPFGSRIHLAIRFELARVGNCLVKTVDRTCVLFASGAKARGK